MAAVTKPGDFLVTRKNWGEMGKAIAEKHLGIAGTL